MTDNWYSYSLKQIEEKLNTDAGVGLSDKAANSRRKRNGANVIYRKSNKDFYDIIKHSVFDYTNLLFFIVTVSAALLERDATYLYLLILQLINIFAVIAVYAKAYNVFGGIEKQSLPYSRVLREGRLRTIRQEALVRGDIIFVSKGDIVPGDARLVESDKLKVLENNLLTTNGITSKDHRFNEARTIPAEQQRNMIFASTVVTSGSGKAVICDIGKDTLCHTLKKDEAGEKGNKKKDIGIISAFEKYYRALGLFMTVLIFILTGIDLVLSNRGIGLFNTFLTGVSLSVSTMSSSLVLFGYIIVGCGIFSAVNKIRNAVTKRFEGEYSGAYIKNPEKLEKIKDINCLVIHRKNILSLGYLEVEKAFISGKIVDAKNKKANDDSLKSLIRYAVISTGAYGANIVSGPTAFENKNPVSNAIISLAENTGNYNMSLDREFPIIDHMNVGNDCNFDTTLTKIGNDYIAVVNGDFSSVIRRCTKCRYNGVVIPMLKEISDNIMLSAAQLSDQSYRIVAIASKVNSFNSLARIRSAQTDLTFEGFFAVREPLITGMAKRINELKEAGIKLILLSDDKFSSDASFAKVVGICKDNSECITGAQMSAMSEKDFAQKADNYNVYTSVSAAQKDLLLRSLREKGYTVGFVGKDLQEAVLMKNADVGFCTGNVYDGGYGKVGIGSESRDEEGSGNCEALKFVSDVIISKSSSDGNGGFSALVGAIENARVIYKNIIRVVKYMLTSQFAKFFIVLYSVLSGSDIFHPIQILFCGLIVDLAAVIVLSFNKPENDILFDKCEPPKKLGNPIINYPEYIVMSVIWVLLTVLLPVLFKTVGIPLNTAEYSSYVFFSFILTQLISLTEIMKDKSLFLLNTKINRVYMLTIISALLFEFVCARITFISDAFGVMSLSFQGFLCMTAVPVLMLVVFEIYKLLVAKGIHIHGIKKQKV